MPSGASLPDSPALIPRDALPGVAWPPVARGRAALMSAMQAQFRASERAAPDAIRALQFRQIAALAAHAREHSPFWRERLDRAGYRPGAEAAADWFAALPVLTRAEAQAAGETIFSAALPPEHGGIRVRKTTGSTSAPLVCRTTDAAMLFWHAFTLRDALWHGRDLSAKLAVIRVGSERGAHRDWGPAYSAFVNGAGVTCDARDDVAAQAEWLIAERPQYLLTHASNLRALAAHFVERGLALDSLREARSYSERQPEDLAERVREAWSVEVTDMYTANEVGYIALQCPRGGYHVQAEDVLVEVVDERGRACGPGAAGRVLVTSLHNFAMPLLRYDIGDYAEAGAPCACGRTLPVLARILGRTRNMMRLPGGRAAWPGFPLNTLTDLPAIRQFRMIQHSYAEIEAQLVLDRPLSAREETRLREAIRTRLRHPFEIRLTRVERFERGPGYKFEDFECRVT